jgi:hypothetical protein
MDDLPMTKPSMLYVRYFHHLNLQESHTMTLLKKHDKS